LIATFHLDGDHYCAVQLDKNGAITNRKDGIRTAVYNEAGTSIIAGCEYGIELLSARDFSEETKFPLSLPKLDDRIKVDKFRVF